MAAFIFGNVKIPFLTTWKPFFRIQYLREDFVSGLTVACVALPLSLALAMASGTKGESGLITAIIAGIIGPLFGGAALSINGPANSMPILVAMAIQKYGIQCLPFLVLASGFLQFLSGVFGFGRVIRFTPLPVIHAFTAGIGALLFIGQLSRALGLPLPDQNHIVQVTIHIFGLIDKIQFESLCLTVVVILIVFLFPRISKRIPAYLAAVLIPTLFVMLMKIKVPLIGNIPASLPLPHLPILPREHILDLLSLSLIAFSLASLETLLSLGSLERLTNKKYNPDHELIGQGLSNIVSSCFCGLPATGVIARSTLNVQAGAKTGRSSIFHSLFMIAAIFMLAPMTSQIPIPVLAGVILSVSLKMLRPLEFVRLWRVSRFEGGIFLVTFFSIIFLGMIVGIQAGILAALVITALHLGRSKAKIEKFEDSGLPNISIEGALTFMSAKTFEQIRYQINQKVSVNGLVIDMSQVNHMDVSGAHQFIEILEPLIRNSKLALVGLTSHCRQTLTNVDVGYNIVDTIAMNSHEVFDILNISPKKVEDSNPHTLFVTCLDGRLNPTAIAGASPGDLYVLRNIGNLVPCAGSDALPAEGAAVEFAIARLKIKEVIICGHSDCDSVQTALRYQQTHYDQTHQLPHMESWLKQLEPVCSVLPPNVSLREAIQANLLKQLENLKTYPLVQEKLSQKELKISIWFFNALDESIEEWDEATQRFIPQIARF